MMGSSDASKQNGALSNAVPVKTFAPPQTSSTLTKMKYIPQNAQSSNPKMAELPGILDFRPTSPKSSGAGPSPRAARE